MQSYGECAMSMYIVLQLSFLHVQLKFMWLTAPVGKMKRILCSDWLTKRARWAQSCLLVIARFDSARLQSTYRVRNFRMTARESQK